VTQVTSTPCQRNLCTPAGHHEQAFLIIPQAADLIYEGPMETLWTAGGTQPTEYNSRPPIIIVPACYPGTV
jgi:hypothetical protein